MLARNFEIWVKGQTLNGWKDKCVAKFHDTLEGADKVLSYAVDTYGPRCEVTLRAVEGHVEEHQTLKELH